MLLNAPYVIIPLFRAGTGLFHATAVNGLNSFCICLVCCRKYFSCSNSRRVSVAYAYSCRGRGEKSRICFGRARWVYDTLLYRYRLSKENAPIVEQVERQVKDTLHFGKW